MLVRIGTMFMGEVDAVGPHSIKTELCPRLEDKELPLRPDVWLTHASGSSSAGP